LHDELPECSRQSLRAQAQKKREHELDANKIRNLMRQPLEGFPIAHPQALITQPQPGYVMELMDGLVPMAELMQVATDALMSDDGLSWLCEDRWTPVA
jgi:hypothetical protein